MDLDDIKAQLDRIFAAGQQGSTREQASGLREALVEFKIGIGKLKEALATTERELDIARKEADDYSRRGQLAQQINDAETVRVADEFTTRARARVDLLERKVLVQRDEVAMGEREYELTRQQFQNASRGVPLDTPATGNLSPDGSVADLMQQQRDRESAVEAQLAHLKKKLGEKK